MRKQKPRLARRLILARTDFAKLTIDDTAGRCIEIFGSGPVALEIESLESGRAQSPQWLPYLAEVYGVLPEWLIMGEGPMVIGGVEAEVGPSGVSLTMDPDYQAWESGQVVRNLRRDDE